MNKRFFLLGFLLLVFAGLVLLSTVIGGIYYLDLMSSLLPYWIVLHTVFLFGIFLLVRRRHNTAGVLFLKTTAIAVFLVILTLTLKFYNFAYMAAPPGKGSTELTLAFLNKLYSNTNYGEIEEKVQTLRPDLLGLSEIKDSDKPQLPVLSNYSCYLSKDARDGATISFYTNYPCSYNNDAPALPFVLPVTVTISDKEYAVFVVHPVPPSSQAWIKQRDDELIALSAYIGSLPSDNVIILGDFNLSPWSKSYTNITAHLPQAKDSAIGMGLNFTWHGALISTQIDHIFVPKNSQVRLFRSEKVAGSDHNMIWTHISV